MNTRTVTFKVCMAVLALALPAALGGCDREVSRTSKTTVKDDGTVKSDETVVKQAPNGTVTKEESSSKSTPLNQ